MTISACAALTFRIETREAALRSGLRAADQFSQGDLRSRSS